MHQDTVMDLKGKTVLDSNDEKIGTVKETIDLSSCGETTRSGTTRRMSGDLGSEPGLQSRGHGDLGTDLGDVGAPVITPDEINRPLGEPGTGSSRGFTQFMVVDTGFLGLGGRVVIPQDGIRRIDDDTVMAPYTSDFVKNAPSLDVDDLKQEDCTAVLSYFQMGAGHMAA